MMKINIGRADGSDGNDVGDDDVIKGAWALTSAHLSESIYDSCLTLLKWPNLSNYQFNYM